MCTVTWVREECGYHLLCNRDERFTRARALPPREHERDGIRYLAPLDGDFGGTWIAVNEYGVTLCLLNGNGPAGWRSRGWLLPELISARTASMAAARLAVLDLRAFAPFTLALLEPDGSAQVANWGGESVRLEKDADHRVPLTSSSYDTAGVRRARRLDYYARRRHNPRIDAAMLYRFHTSHSAAPGAYSTCMHRDDAATVSFSWISVTAGRFAFSTPLPLRASGLPPNSSVSCAQPDRYRYDPLSADCPGYFPGCGAWRLLHLHAPRGCRDRELQLDPGYGRTETAYSRARSLTGADMTLYLLIALATFPVAARGAYPTCMHRGDAATVSLQLDPGCGGTETAHSRARSLTGTDMTPYLLIALATFTSEDLTCIAAGILIAQRQIGLPGGVAACIAGIFVGDLLLYCAGRWCGRPLLRWRPVAGVLTEERFERASAWLARRGAKVVLASRFTPGLRLPTYIAAGMLRTRFWAFVGYFLLAAALWTPLLVLTAAFFGDRLLRTLFTHSGARLGFALAFAGAAAAHFLARHLARRARPAMRIRRRLTGWMLRIVRWEFWPIWAAYLPVIPYILHLAVKHRSPTLFTAANPGIPTGGLAGESKSAILAELGPGLAYAVIPDKLSVCARIDAALAFLRNRGLDFPVVLKPDVGERGSGVAVVRTRGDLARYLAAAAGTTIIQEYADGLEFGIFYYRYPWASAGNIFSITWKCFPEVVGDGVSTVEDLILADRRAVCKARAYLRSCGRPATFVPQAGERIRLVELGSHSLGAVFLDGTHLLTGELRQAIDGVARRHRGFYIGRFDVRTPSVEDLRAGRFAVLELNGVGGEPTHIYDPAIGIIPAYRALFTQWRLAFTIGAENRRRGVRPMPLAALWRALRDRAVALQYTGLYTACDTANSAGPTMMSARSATAPGASAANSGWAATTTNRFPRSAPRSSAA